MASTRITRVVADASFHAIGVLLLALTVPRMAQPAEPDIPRITADAERGSIRQEIELASAYFSGHGVARDDQRAAYWYEKAANSGDPGAQEEIGYFYQAGIGVKRDPARAAKWFERAAAGGSTGAKVNLGVAYMWGQGVRKDPELAVQLFREAAEKGNGSGACFLADSYYFGTGVAKDVSKAMHWFEIGAKRHDPQAQFDLAVVLLGQSRNNNSESAMKLLHDSAAQGYVPAKHRLAVEMVQRSDFATSGSSKQAIALLEEASSVGFWKSTALLAILYRDGRGEPLDKEQAYYRFKIAVQQGGDPAATLLNKDLQALESKLEPSHKAALDANADEWARAHSQALEYVHLPGGSSLPTVVLAYPKNETHAGQIFPAPEISESGGDSQEEVDQKQPL